MTGVGLIQHRVLDMLGGMSTIREIRATFEFDDTVLCAAFKSDIIQAGLVPDGVVFVTIGGPSKSINLPIGDSFPSVVSVAVLYSPVTITLKAAVQVSIVTFVIPLPSQADRFCAALDRCNIEYTEVDDGFINITVAPQDGDAAFAVARRTLGLPFNVKVA